MHSSPTIKDIAAIAGVHFTTVSMALRNHARIPEETRSRIQAIALRVGYQRNPAFTALSQRRTKVKVDFQNPRMAYISNRSEKNGLFRTAHHRRFTEGARRQAEAMGYAFEMLYFDEGAHDQASLQAYLRRERIGGVILGAFEAGRSELSLAWDELSAVKIDTLHMPPELPFVANDQFHAVRTSLQILRRRGYRRIGLAIGLQDEECSDDQHLCALYSEQLAMEPTERVPPLLFPHAATHREALPMLESWIHGHRIDAVLSNWTSIRSLLQALGLECPGNIACASICLSRRTPNLSGIVSNLDQVGERAAALLAELMRSERRGAAACATRTYVKGHWEDGSSAPDRNS